MASKKITEIAGLAGCEFFDLKSENVEDTFRVFVSCPPYLDRDKKFPVIYVLDGNALFFSVIVTHGGMIIGGELPPAVIVGIGYPDGFGFAQRARDYTPTPVADHRRNDDAGGGPAFLKFLIEELKPLIEEDYLIDPEDATITGVSLGGLFALWVLLKKPQTFQRYIICSPSLQINNEEAWQWETDAAADLDDIAANVFVAAGSLETEDVMQDQFRHGVRNDPTNREWLQGVIDHYDAVGWPRGVAAVVPEFVDKIRKRGYPRLEISDMVLKDETHMSVPPAAISRGLRFVFGKWSPGDAD